jgi:hypothetical protein
MSDNALIVVSSWGYLKAINALFNSLEYHGNHDLDVYYIHGKALIDYANYIRDKFSFTIYPFVLEEIWEKPIAREKDINTNAIFARYRFCQKIRHKHKAICFIDADCLLLDNIMSYFKIVANTDLLLCPANVRSSFQLDDYRDMPDSKKEELHRAFPVLKYPWFHNPKYHGDLVDYLWDNRTHHNPSLDIDNFNVALWKLNKLDKIHPLDGSLWLAEPEVSFLHKYVMTIRKHGNRFYVYTPTGDKVRSLHTKLWMSGKAKHELDVTSQNDMAVYRCACSNISVINRMYDLFNDAGKVLRKDVNTLNSKYQRVLYA